GVLAGPGNPIEAFVFGRESELGLAVGVGLQRARENVLVVVAFEFQLPGLTTGFGRRRENRRAGAQAAKRLAFDFAAVGIEPDLEPGIARDLDRALGLNRLVVRVLGLEFHLHLILRGVEVVLGVGVDVIALAGDADGAVAGDFAAAGVGDARLDAIFVFLAVVAGRIETERRASGGIRLEGFAFDDLALAAIPAAAAGPAAGLVIIVIPLELVRAAIEMIEGILIDEHLHGGVGDGSAEVIIRLDVHVYRLADAEGFLAAVFRGRLDVHLELGELVFLEPEECGRADHGVTAFVPEGHLVFAERHGFSEIERAPDAAEGVELDLVLLDLGAARVVDFKFDCLVRGRRIDRTVIAPGDEFPLHGFLRAIGWTVGAGINFPGLPFASVVIGILEGEGLAVLEHGAREDLLVGGSLREIEDGNA